MFFSIAFAVVVVALVLYGQSRIRPVPRILRLRLPIVLGAIGLIQVLDYTGAHHVSAGGFWLVAGATVVGAGVLGILRALTVKIWASNNWIVRQGTGLTMGLWVLSLALQLTGGIGAGHVGAAGLEAESFLLYLALTLGVQAYVVHQRALPMWRALGPDAGPRIRVTFGAGPAGAGSFFAGFGGAPNGGGEPFRHPSHNDPTIIDAEVVEDDDPPELR
jgi:hypothetical protein